MELYYNTDFVSREMFFISFDYEKCMEDSFHKELYNIFRRAKAEVNGSIFTATFDIYLHAAYKACAFLMMDIDIYGTKTYMELFGIAYDYMCQANVDDNYITDNDPQAVPHLLFSPAEVFLIEHLAYAILAAKASPSAPYQLIEVFEDQLTLTDNIANNITRFIFNREVVLCLDRKSNGKELAGLWSRINGLVFSPIKELSIKYSRRIDADIQLHAYEIDILSDWDNEDMSQWVCYLIDHKGAPVDPPRYSSKKAHHFLHFWDDYDDRHAMVQLIEAWSKENPECFETPYRNARRYKTGDIPSANLGIVEPRRLGPDPEEQEKARAQAIAELYAYIEELDRENRLDDEDHAEPDTPMMAIIPVAPAMPIHLNLDGKEGRTKVNVIRIFNVMHRLGFFVDADGQPMTKHALFAALSTALNAPELSDWGNSLYTSRSKALSDHSAQKKIFEKMKGNQEKFINEMKKKHEKELDEELLDIFNRLQEEQLAILDQSDEKKSKQR